MHRHRRSLVVGGFTASFVLFCGCERWQSAATSNEAPAHPFRLHLLATESCPLPAHLNPRNVKILSYRVRLEGNTDNGVPANYFYASLLTSDGERYLSSYHGCKPLLSADPLLPKESAEGFLNFSIPPSKLPEKLVYAPALLPTPNTDPSAVILLQSSTDAARPPNDAP